MGRFSRQRFPYEFLNLLFVRDRAQGNDDGFFGIEGFAQLLQVRKLRTASSSARIPNGDQNHLVAQIGQLDLLPLDRGQGEFRSRKGLF